MIKHLFKPIDAAILIYFRFFAGIFLSFELINSLSLGDFKEYTAPFHFSYLFFDWVTPWPYWGLIIHYTLTILAGFTFAFGIRQKLSAVILFFGYTLLFLMEKSEYINHLYLYCLISFWLIWMPVVKKNRLEAPAWYYYLMLFHISIVYFYAGVAKLNPDWLSGNGVMAMMNDLNPSLKMFYSYGGLLFDLLIVPFLIWRRTRTLAFIAALIFHITNVYNFGLATFPWFSIMMTAMFFGSSWPRKFTWFDHYLPDSTRKVTVYKWLPAVLAVYCVIQLAVPLRHHLYSGNPSWTEDGHMFSWRMKLRTKTGNVVFYVVDKHSNSTQIVFPKHYLTRKQNRDMVGKPDSILQFAHYLKKISGDVSVHASARVSLNGAPKQEMIDVQRDLGKEERKIGSYDWLLNEKGPGVTRALSYQD